MENEFISIKDGLTDIFTRLEELQKCKNVITGVSTGFVDLDYAIKGLNKSNLIVIASRPAMGKTTLAFNIATHVATKENTPVAIFSLEMSKEQCINRIISSQALVENSKLYTGKLEDDDWNKIEETIGELSETQLYINDTPGISIDEIREKCIKLKEEKNIGLVVIDYFQLLGCNISCNSCEQEISISRALKKMAEELNIPIIAISELSRRPEERFYQGEDPRPNLNDLEYSRSLVKDADVIMLLYRYDYYYQDIERENIAEIIIAKNKYGYSNNATVELLFIGKYLKFINKDYNFGNYRLKEYGFTDEIIIEILNYCHMKGATNIEYVLSVAENWYKNNIRTVKDLEYYYEKFKKIDNVVFKLSGLINRQLTEYEKTYIEKWLYEYKITDTTIIKEVKSTKPNINFDEIDKLLKEQ